ncbi:uncharacterized protein [Coffea arabica]|uniref:Uncharacterized protein n=1 Tax=Coffea arabica TaxID=13443 RepID=A0A6P6V7W0_COFAR|nr:uncharacterized protein LOC113718262 [Coffea arabica]
METVSIGRFTLRSAFQLVRRHANRSFMSRRLWHPMLPLKISFFLLRLLHGHLPVDCGLWKFGVHGASRCGCCPFPDIKSVEHVFAEGDMASRVWHFFGDPVGISWTGTSFCVRLAAWNSMRYEGIQVGLDRLCNLVMSDLLELFALYFKQRRSFPVAWVQFYADISRWVPRVSYTLVRWSRLSGDVLKLNTDECSKSNPGVSGEGGVLRDRGGSLLLAFSCHLGQATSVQAEVRAQLFGVKVCVQRGFGRLDIELDSVILVHILLGKAGCPWSVYHEIQQLFELKEHVSRVGHCLRQANQVADVLSNVGCAHGREVIYTLARGAMCLDRIGFPFVKRIVQDHEVSVACVLEPTSY